MVPGAEDPRRGARARRRPHRPVRADHAEPGGDGRVRRGDGAARAADSPVDWRCHDVEGAHRGQGGAEVLAGRCCGSRTPPGRCRSPRPCCRDEQRPGLLAEVKADYDAVRARHAAKHGERALLSLADARANATVFDWTGHRPRRPHLLLQQAKDTGYPGSTRWAGRPSSPARSTTIPVEELRGYIDWTPFFGAWELKGRFPDILNHPASGEAARRLYEDAQVMLDRLEREQWLHANAVIGLVPGQLRRRRHRGLHRRDPHRGAHGAAQPAPAGGAPGRHTEPLQRRLRRAEVDRAARLRGGLRGHGRARHAGADRGVPGRPRRLQRDPARGARRPARRGVRRADARAGATRVLGVRPGRAARSTRRSSASSMPASAPPRGTPPARTTPRSRRCGRCST